MEQTKEWASGFLRLCCRQYGRLRDFMLPSTLAQTASPLGVTAAWLVTGAGC
ncbi:hypothetical protein PO124_08095 [Bacillus licheniformis]|nr:hypothetical protein [Bacillus licheniformis]